MPWKRSAELTGGDDRRPGLLKTRANQAAGSEVPTPLDEAMRRIRPAFLHLCLFSALINLLGFSTIVFGMQAIDRVMTTRSVETLYALTGLFIVAAGLGAVLRSLRSSILRRLGITFNDVVAEKIYDASYYTSLQTGRLDSIRMFHDFETVRDFSTGPSLASLLDFPWMPLYIVAAFLIHFWVGVILVIAVLVVCLLLLIGDISNRTNSRQDAEFNARSDRVRDTAFKEAETIHAMAMLKGFRARWLETYKVGQAWRLAVNHHAESVGSVLKLLRSLLSFGMVLVSALLVMQGEASAGSMMATMMIAGACLGIGQAAIGRWPVFLRARQAYGRIQRTLQSLEADANRLTLPKPAGHLDVRNLAMAAPGANRFIISQVSFALPAGSAMGVIGPSGAGKSTLVRALVGIWPPTHGTVRLDGAEMHHWDADLLGLHLGYLPQNVELLSGTIAENIARFGQVDDDAVLEAAKLAGVHDVIQGLPQGYNTQVGEGGNALSGGQRQRVGLARALYGNPALIVLDEPNSNLDAIGETALAEALRAMKERGTTCILITHKANILKMVDFVLVLKDGTMSAFGPRDTVLAPAGIPSIPPPPANPQIQPRRTDTGDAA